MAGRYYKQGLDYFKLSVDYGTEDAIELIDGEFGAKGFRVITKLLQRIYKKDGYYIEWNDKRKILFANAINEQVSLVDDIITRSFKWGLFEQSLFTQLGILTSADIQHTYLEAVKRRERVEIIKEYSLCDIRGYANAICVNINSKSVIEPPQSKEQYSTEKKSTEKEVVAPAAPTAPTDVGKKEKKKFVPPTLPEVEKYFLTTVGDPKQPNAWREDRCINQAGQCFDHYTANGWVQGRGKPIKNWQAACRNWMRNELNGTYGPKQRVDLPPKKNEPPLPLPTPQVEQPPTKMPKTATEINYLFERFLEVEEHVTIISVEAGHYDYLKKAGRINWTAEQTAAIRKKATDHIAEKNLETDEKNIVRFMKLFGVIEFFQQQKTNGDEKIFNEEDFANTAAFKALVPVPYRH